ncbi:MAG: hypothetical protein L6R37_006798 [Teloschistes peruensis]|nr:MAG: hypothetical protein L6R37_006798 [Teloschistes peruensis]
MEHSIVNILLTSFPGLGLPPTLSLPVPTSTSITQLRSILANRLPQSHHRLILTTTSNKELPASSLAPISGLLTSERDTILPLRLSVPVCGGKGGFGSQLRAAGGRMSSKRKRNQGDQNSSNRNLDGRRLRTVAEAKALAEYLAVKPEMEKKEKDACRKRWEQVVELAEKREAEIKHGSKARVDGKWVEDKDDIGERTREAVFAAMASDDYRDTFRSLSQRSVRESPSSLSQGDVAHDTSRPDLNLPSPAKAMVDSRSYFGFDEDQEDFSSDEDNEGDSNAIAQRR